ncbi:MAG: allene oxide cyclase family protein [Actinomycetota bacterium]
MRKALSIAAAALAIVLVAGLVAQARTTRNTRATVVHVIEHAKTDTVIDTGKAGDTTGDLLTWHNKVYDETDTSVAGKDQGECIRISPKQGTWECTWITWVAGGSITVEGPFYDTKDSVLAITGGTGTYADATGSMQLVSKNGGTEYDFIFNIS